MTIKQANLVTEIKQLGLQARSFGSCKVSGADYAIPTFSILVQNASLAACDEANVAMNVNDLEHVVRMSKKRGLIGFQGPYAEGNRGSVRGYERGVRITYFPKKVWNTFLADIEVARGVTQTTAPYLKGNDQFVVLDEFLQEMGDLFPRLGTFNHFTGEGKINMTSASALQRQADHFVYGLDGFLAYLDAEPGNAHKDLVNRLYRLYDHSNAISNGLSA